MPADDATYPAIQGAEGPLAVRVIDSPDQLAALEADWRALSARLPQPNVFMTFEWALATWRHSAPESASLHVVVVARDDRAVLIAPFMRRVVTWKAFSARKIEFLDAGLIDYGDLICDFDSTPAIRRLAVFLADRRAEWDMLDLRNVADDAHWLASFRAAASDAKLESRLSPWESCPYFPIASPWDEYLTTRSRATRSTYRNQARRLEREGIQLRVVEDPRREPMLLDRMSELERQRGGPNSATTISDNRAFFDEIFPPLAALGMLYVVLAEQNDRLVAFQLGFRCGAKLWDYSKAYAADLAKLSLGTMLVPVAVDYGFSAGFTEYDFLRGSEPYKLRLATGTRPTHRLEIWSGRIRSRGAAFLAASRRKRNSAGSP